MTGYLQNTTIVQQSNGFWEKKAVPLFGGHASDLPRSPVASKGNLLSTTKVDPHLCLGYQLLCKSKTAFGLFSLPPLMQVSGPSLDNRSKRSVKSLIP